MHEFSPPRIKGRPALGDPSGLQRRLVAILQASPAPTICVAQERQDDGDQMVAGSALLHRIRSRVTALQRLGMRSGDVLVSGAVGAERVEDALACIVGGFAYWPAAGQERLGDGPLVTDSGSALVWLRNPPAHEAAEATMLHQPPAALPIRMTVALHDAMQPGGRQIRVLVSTTSGSPPFAVNAQTIARLGSTLRRRLGIKRQSVRFCAAPTESAVGVLLDLLPGIAARQVMVVPSELSPGTETIMSAMVRYHPDSLTLTLAQARALAHTTLEQEVRTALRQTALLIADTHPIPRDLREHFAAITARLDVGYILPEAGDAYLV